MQEERKNLWASNFPAPTPAASALISPGANSAAGGSEGSAAPKRERKPRKAVGTPGKRIAINTLVTLLVGAVYFYLELPAINLHAEEFYVFVLLLCAVYCGLRPADLRLPGRRGPRATSASRRSSAPSRSSSSPDCSRVAVAGGVASWRSCFRAGQLPASSCTVENGDFAAEMAGGLLRPASPCWTRTAPRSLGDRKLGELSDMVSQFEVSEDYTQINYHGRPVRVTPLRLRRTSSSGSTTAPHGLPAYLIVDMVDSGAWTVRAP